MKILKNETRKKVNDISSFCKNKDHQDIKNNVELLSNSIYGGACGFTTWRLLENSLKDKNLFFVKLLNFSKRNGETYKHENYA